MSAHPLPHAEDPQAYVAMLERSNRFREAEVRAAIAALALPPGSRGLDVGCGVGLYTLWLAEAVGPHGRVVGLDRAAVQLAAAPAPRRVLSSSRPPGFRAG
ncbi:MAG: hypothetical protein KatS3mg131_0708 [Candidatus Tectimicrobiota bacterium]|nr:MAG: hypothetical protein KatS3mg131_0708 [Candidatus Tectomicrobia bacterium]